MAEVKLTELGALPETGTLAVEVEGRSVLVCRSTAGVFAVENRCSHALSALEGGRVRGPHIFCPLHGVRFDLRDGTPQGTLTTKPIETYAVRVDGEAVLAELPWC
jgi:3-phenylpropionate/trans-cinnamate dioxygenase ferredoxin subunit